MFADWVCRPCFTDHIYQPHLPTMSTTHIGQLCLQPTSMTHIHQLHSWTMFTVTSTTWTHHPDMYTTSHCTTHGSWSIYIVVRSMTHGVPIPTELLYSPWPMGYICCCTVHDPWGGCTIVQPMTHGIPMLPEPLYGP